MNNEIILNVKAPITINSILFQDISKKIQVCYLIYQEKKLFESKEKQFIIILQIVRSNILIATEKNPLNTKSNKKGFLLLYYSQTI